MFVLKDVFLSIQSLVAHPAEILQGCCINCRQCIHIKQKLCDHKVLMSIQPARGHGPRVLNADRSPNALQEQTSYKPIIYVVKQKLSLISNVM